MKLLVIASGGDGAGMNKVLATLYRKFKKNIFACDGGFEALYKNDIKPLYFFEPLKHENEAGCCIKSGRFPQFKEEKYFKVALKNARNYDYVIVMGGNGSEMGCQDLTKGGVKTIFIPGTIDNDVLKSEYSIGFDSAVHACVQMISNIMPSMETMGQSCVLEVMGRHCSKIAEEVANRTKADLCVKEKTDLKYVKIANLIKSKAKKRETALIILRENIVDIREFADEINGRIGAGVLKKQIAGYVQRGPKPTEKELLLAKEFALKAIEVVKKNSFSKKILMQNGHIVKIDSEAKRDIKDKKFK